MKNHEDKLFENAPERVKKLHKASKALKRDKDRKQWKAKQNGY
jgi:hypothetical protein